MSSHHRKLMVSAVSQCGRMRKLGFMRLPDELQDRIIEALDRRQITFKQAEAICREHGHSLNRESIRTYYKSLTRERKAYEMNSSVAQAIHSVEGMPAHKTLETLLNLLASIMTQGLLEDRIGIKDLDMAKLLSILFQITSNLPTADRLRKTIQKGGDNQAIRKAVQDIYGLQLHENHRL